jgi:peroxiredoxin Q/BCP
MATVAIGKKIPTFRGEATGGSPVASEDLKGTRFVLYFYPRDNTPGCTVESNDFRDLHAKFKRKKVRVLGISRDTLKSHERFKEKFGFPFELIADPDETICKLFGVMKDKNMYGKKVRGIERSTFVLDREGRVAKAWRAVKVPDHVQDVLAFVQSI